MRKPISEEDARMLEEVRAELLAFRDKLTPEPDRLRGDLERRHKEVEQLYVELFEEMAEHGPDRHRQAWDRFHARMRERVDAAEREMLRLAKEHKQALEEDRARRAAQRALTT